MMSIPERDELNQYFVENEQRLHRKACSLVRASLDVFAFIPDGIEDSASILTNETYIEAVTCCDHVNERYSSFYPLLVGIMKRLIKQKKRELKLHPLSCISYPSVDDERSFHSPALVAVPKQEMDVNSIDFLVNMERGDLEETIARRDCLERMLAHLDEQDRDLFRLRYIHQLPTKRIAEMLCLSPVNVRVRLGRITKRLGKIFENDKGV